jgi:Ca-activated chloride channel family protein
VKTVLLAFAAAVSAWGDAGVLVPAGHDQPDPAIFSLDEMTVEIRIDNGIARVCVRQIFGNRSETIQEGSYTFSLPSRASVSDFAVWDGVVRIPGVILERRRAEEIYSRVRAMAIDPGLLQMGERGEDEASRNEVFTAKIVPIPSFGTKRIELEYQERLAVENYQSLLAVPLRPGSYRQQTAGHLTVTLEVHSEHAIDDFAVVSKAYPLQVREKTANYVRAEFFANNVALTEDLALRYRYAAAGADTMKVISQTDGGENFFQAMALLRARENTAAKPAAGRTVIALFDNSLSMQWEKLERSFQAAETLLKRLRPVDRFNLILFNSDTAAFRPAPVTATPQNVEASLAFIRSSGIRGGTDLRKALSAGLAQVSPGTNQASGERFLVLVSDGGATGGMVNNGRLAKWYTGEWGRSREPHTFVFAVGDDANLPLARMLASNHGVWEWVRSTEPIDFKLDAFLAKIGEEPVRGLALRTAPASNFRLVYPIEDIHFAGSAATWVGQYTKPGPASFGVTGTQIAVSAALSTQGGGHPYLPRAWARARVDALLDKIARDGEDAASIDEIIRLSKKYKFVTPYTSFLAVPRALLRPRVIRPGDPVLRIHTDRSIVSVIAMFPFGLVKPMRYLEDEDAWQTRFLAPSDMNDGTYQVRLVLRDKQGRVYREAKSFVIASKAPAIRVKLGEPNVKAGGRVTIAASASANTRTITARLWGVEPVSLRWNAAMKTNAGEMQIPLGMPAGKYKVVVTAEDIAHNIASEEVALEVR